MQNTNIIYIKIRIFDYSRIVGIHNNIIRDIIILPSL